MLNPIERENEILGILEKFSEADLKYIIVGGYAVSAYRHRFSVDADIVIKREDVDKFAEILHKNGFRKTISRNLENAYSSEFARYEKFWPKVSVDLLIGAIASRQTDASFSFEFLFQNSNRRNIEGTEKTIAAQVPVKEILIILKLHSGRLTDFRDIAALSFDLDMDFIRKNLFRGNKAVVKDNMKQLSLLIEKSEFQDSFKGVFMEKNYRLNPEEIKRLADLKEVKFK